MRNRQKWRLIVANDPVWMSICCSAEPMYELHDLDESMDMIGICSKCKDHTSFELWGDEDKYDEI